LRLAAARTFVTEDEARQLHAAGVARHVSTSDLLVYGPNGPIENRLRYEDECVRHKTLDLIGDLALCGRPICGSIVAFRSGHRLNAALATELLRASAVQQERRCGVRLSA
jgi:UDP-3-O-acyl-N-acetylglucosamine deacetylase